MIIVQLKCTVICSQRPTVNIRLRLETPDRFCVCVSFLTSSCLILFLERIGETSRLSGAWETSRGRKSSSSSTWFHVCSLWLWIFVKCLSLHVHSLFLCFSLCFWCIYVFIFPLRSCGNGHKQKEKKKVFLWISPLLSGGPGPVITPTVPAAFNGRVRETTVCTHSVWPITSWGNWRRRP